MILTNGRRLTAVSGLMRRFGPWAHERAMTRRHIERCSRQLPELIDGLDERRDLWGDEWDALQAAVAGLGSGRLRAEQSGAIGVLIHALGVA